MEDSNKPVYLNNPKLLINDSMDENQTSINKNLISILASLRTIVSVLSEDQKNKYGNLYANYYSQVVKEYEK